MQDKNFQMQAKETWVCAVANKTPHAKSAICWRGFIPYYCPDPRLQCLDDPLPNRVVQAL